MQFHIDTCTEKFYTGRNTGSHTIPIQATENEFDAALNYSQQAARDTLRRSYQNMDPARRQDTQRSLVIRPHKGVFGDTYDKGATTGSYDRIPAVSRWKELPKPVESEQQKSAASTSGVHAAIYRAMNTDTMNPHGFKQFLDGRE